MKTRKYEELLPHEFFAELDRCPIAWMPCGILEWHGKQSALGLDGLKVYGMCLRAAERAGGIVLPVTWWGPGGVFPPSMTREELADFGLAPGTMCIDRDVSMQLYTDIFEQLEHVGFRVIIALGGHYPAGDMLRGAAEEYNKRGGATVWGDRDPVLIKEEGGGSDHGGSWETSLLWAMRPDLVDFSHMDDDCGGRAPTPGYGVGEGPVKGETSREFGEKWAAIAVDNLVRIAEELLAKTKERDAS